MSTCNQLNLQTLGSPPVYAQKSLRSLVLTSSLSLPCVRTTPSKSKGRMQRFPYVHQLFCGHSSLMQKWKTHPFGSLFPRWTPFGGVNKKNVRLDMHVDWCKHCVALMLGGVCRIWWWCMKWRFECRWSLTPNHVVLFSSCA